MEALDLVLPEHNDEFIDFGVPANVRSVRIRMGVPFSSVNCFEGDAPLLFARDGDAMRVPRPAAGMMTVTFMEGAQYTSGAEVVQMGARVARPGAKEFHARSPSASLRAGSRRAGEYARSSG